MATIAQVSRMKAFRTAGVLVLGASLVFGAPGCGDDDDDEDDGGASVVSVSVDNNPISVLEESKVSTNITFSSDDVFDDDRNVEVVVKLPNNVSFKPDTAEIDQPSGDDRGVGVNVRSCPDGSTFISVDLDEDDLVGAENPSGNADAQLNFLIVGASAGTQRIDASASVDGVLFSCDTFVPDATTAIVVN
jgi:hypothetical protein